MTNLPALDFENNMTMNLLEKTEAAQNPFTPPEILARLAEDEDFRVEGACYHLIS
jgi:hypothetical protein